MKTIKNVIKTLIVLLLIITSVSNNSFKVHAEPTDGYPYAILTEDGDLIFLRSYESIDVYEHYGEETEIVDINERTYKGLLFQETGNADWMQGIVGKEYAERVKRAYVAENTIMGFSEMYGWFRGCSNLISFDGTGFHHYDESGIYENQISNMSYMFEGCKSIKRIDISTFNTTESDFMYGVFSDCCSLEEIKLGPNFVNWENANLPAGTWRNGNLRKTETQLMNAYTANANEWAGTWRRDIISVDQIVINPGSVVLEPGDELDLYCTVYPESATIKEVKWSSSDESVATVNNYGDWCRLKALKYGDVTITVESYDESKASDSITIHVLDSFAYAVLQDNGDLVFLRSGNVYNSYEKTTVTDINGVKYEGIVFGGFERRGFDWWWTHEEFDESLLWINKEYRELVKNVYVAKNNSIYPSSMNHWFSVCWKLKSFDGSGFETYGTQSMEGMFNWCESLKSVNVNSFNSYRVLSYQNMFAGCTSLEELSLSVFDTELATDMETMFSDCYSLKELDISSFNTKNIRNMDSMFEKCCSLSEIKLGPDFVVWKNNAYLPEGNWKNGSLQRTEKRLYSDYPQNASSWAGIWKRDLILATGLSVSRKKIQVERNSYWNLEYELKPANVTAKIVKLENSDSSLIYAHLESSGNYIWIESLDKLGTCTLTLSTVDGSNITTTITVEVVDKINDEINTELTRIYGSNRFNTSMAISDFLSDMKGGKHETIILANGDNFADALAGSYLAAVKSAPIIITRKGKEAEINKYIRSVLKSNGTLYVLGGQAAVPDSCLSGLDGKGYQIKRLAGNNRYLTNLEILNEAGVTGNTLLISTGTNYADSLSASATGLPMLLVKDSLSDQQKAFLKEHKGMNLIILGGKNAVSESVEKALKSYGTVDRIQGANRAGTSIAIGERFFPNTSSAVIAYSHDFPDGLCGGPLAYRLGAPLVLTRDNDADATASFIKYLRVEEGYILGGTSRLTDSLVRKVFGVSSKTKIKEIKK